MTHMRFSNIGVAVANIEQALLAYHEIFGYIVLSGSFNDPIQRGSVCLIGTGISGDLVRCRYK